MSSHIIWICLIFFAALLIFLFQRLTKKRFLNGRELIDFKDIHDALDEKISFDTCTEVLRALGNSYSIDPKLLRSTDLLKQIYDIDSWSLGAGDEKIEQWLADKGIKHVNENKLKTISDLMILVENHRNEKGNGGNGTALSISN